MEGGGGGGGGRKAEDTQVCGFLHSLAWGKLSTYKEREREMRDVWIDSTRGWYTCKRVCMQIKRSKFSNNHSN